ncbi:MAG: Rrf2 family transcriptional regulator [Candidatus Glassbacteria bacterium]|nr:Rrf2 family transcriptional regulator [Candidatus Glassbacteria bacterium]
MQISNKCYYALRALFELSLNASQSQPVKIGLIASKQRIPKRFLEVILSELRQGGFVQSRRGVEGGYILARRPEQITIGEVVRFVDRDLAPVACVSDSGQNSKCEFSCECPFYDFWLKAKQALDSVYDGTTMSDIVERWRSISAKDSFNYEI